MKQLEKDILELKEQRAAHMYALRELQGNMLKGVCVLCFHEAISLIILSAGTRKEEIVRFNKANTDTEFAKMLKVRTLGPEHLETQSQLRRNIRVRKSLCW